MTEFEKLKMAMNKKPPHDRHETHPINTQEPHSLQELNQEEEHHHMEVPASLVIHDQMNHHVLPIKSTPLPPS